MDLRTVVFASLLLIVIVSMIALAVVMLRRQRRAEEESVLLERRISDTSPAPSRPRNDPSSPSVTEIQQASPPRPAPAALDISVCGDETTGTGIEPEERAELDPSSPQVAEYSMRAPVELGFEDSIVGVRSGSRTYDSFRKYADALLGDLKDSRSEAR